MTAIAETAFPLSVLSLMASVRPLARCFVQTDSFLPTVLSDGRAIMDSTPLVRIPSLTDFIPIRVTASRALDCN